MRDASSSDCDHEFMTHMRVARGIQDGQIAVDEEKPAFEID
jgi:hypothetical protein